MVCDFYFVFGSDLFGTDKFVSFVAIIMACCIGSGVESLLSLFLRSTALVSDGQRSQLSICIAVNLNI